MTPTIEWLEQIVMDWQGYAARFGIAAEVANGAITEDGLRLMADAASGLIARVRTLENALTEACDGWTDALGLAPDDRRTPGERRDEARITTLREIAAGKTPR